ncbi:uncharacterized protein LOC106461815 [Limulus polyphemus]|uniref:Uncharacterized protein LOC106461815 n=1 Tax=Limulus polyphemus TaxID=6850 RepID=A0ABM1B8S2_LIMPO|nr:uncharacterized protein LOC106461815 [Limulus polyphemus]
MFFSATNTVYCPLNSGTASLLSADGTRIIKEKNGINARWTEHFNQLLNRLCTVDQTSVHYILQRPVCEDLDLPTSEEEVIKAIKQTACGRALDKDGIPAKLYKSLGTVSFEAFHDVLTSIWEEEELPTDLGDATSVALYKGKGANAYCSNYRGISLHSIAGKFIARIS